MDLPYSVGEIIQIGLNQATYLAMKDKIDAGDTFVETLEERPSQEHRNEIDRFIKGYVRNKGMRIYPNYPVFVDRMKNLLHGNILDPVSTGSGRSCACYNGKFFCLYHVMLRTLRYTNEVVVDISNNCPQALFWLGAAHGLDVHAITVMHEKTNGEKETDEERKPRYIFDVAGLWTAIFRKNDTEGFYEQLALAQHGIERQSKLMLPDSELYKNELDEYFSSFNKTLNWMQLKVLMDGKKEKERRVLESYYRTHFWMPMLSYNQLSIFVAQRDERDDNGEPRISTAKWDFDTISKLSSYLSKRKMIGQYKLITLDKTSEANACAEEIRQTNFICVGSFARPLGQEGPGLSDYIGSKISPASTIHKWADGHVHVGKDISALLKGFARIGNVDEGYYTHIPQMQLKKFYQKHPADGIEKPKIISSIQTAQDNEFAQDINGVHYEIAQLVLWREDSETTYGYSHYWVSIVGNSGPATLALSAVLTGEDPKLGQRKQVESESSGNFPNFLFILQAEVRKQLVEHFRKKLTHKMKEIAFREGWDSEKQQIKEYFNLVLYAVSFYLQTVLYRYFFPFLTQNDMERIYNGIYNIINSMKAAKVSPFVLGYTAIQEDGFDMPVSDTIVRAIAEEIPKILLSVLQSFKGLETFYCVQVEHHLDDETKDTREIKSIDIMQVENGINTPQVVNCFILDPDQV